MKHYDIPLSYTALIDLIIQFENYSLHSKWVLYFKKITIIKTLFDLFYYN